MKDPMKDATMPTMMVSQIGMGWRPGTTKRPRAPMMSPTIIVMMIPVMVMVTPWDAARLLSGRGNRPTTLVVPWPPRGQTLGHNS
jgi:hypothetical protein